MIDANFIRQLAKKTREKVFRWSETPEDDCFRLMLTSGIIRIHKYFESFDLRLLDANSREIGRIDDASDPSLRAPLHELWETARNSARNTEQAIDAIVREVEQAYKPMAGV